MGLKKAVDFTKMWDCHTPFMAFKFPLNGDFLGGCSSNGGKKPSMEIDGIRSLLPYESSAQIVSLHAH